MLIIYCDFEHLNILPYMFFNRQANLWISTSIGSSTSKCWILGKFPVFCKELFFWDFCHEKFLLTFPCLIQLSYIVVDLLIWWGIRSYINDFRKRKLNLPPIAYFSMYHGSISHLPTGYLWSPHVVPKPQGMHGIVIIFRYLFAFFPFLVHTFSTPIGKDNMFFHIL